LFENKRKIVGPWLFVERKGILRIVAKSADGADYTADQV